MISATNGGDWQHHKYRILIGPLYLRDCRAQIALSETMNRNRTAGDNVSKALSKKNPSRQFIVFR